MLVYSKSASLKTIRRDALQEVRWAAAAFRYRRDPAGYAREVLGVEWWHKQVEVAEALLLHKRVFVKASHSVGKSFLAGGLVNWFFDCFDPGICITTAPNAPQVRDILWKEVRVQRPAEMQGALQPRAPRMESSPEHFAVGYTSRDGSGFQGRHEEFVLIVFDECVGVAAEFWEAAEGMMTGDNCYFLALCNPTDTGSRAYIECLNTEKWHVVEISALEHPNIAADLAGEPAPFPKAVRLGWVRGKLREWCGALSPPTHSRDFAQMPQMNADGGGVSPPTHSRDYAQISQMDAERDDRNEGREEGGVGRAGSAGSVVGVSSNAQCLMPNAAFRAGDFEFPPGSGRWYRAGALFESRVLGRWPSQGSSAVWSEAA